MAESSKHRKRREEEGDIASLEPQTSEVVKYDLVNKHSRCNQNDVTRPSLL